MDQEKVKELEELICVNPEVTVANMSSFELDDDTTKADIMRTKGQQNSPEFTYGTSGGNTYISALKNCFQKKPSLMERDSLKAKQAEIYAFGHVGELLKSTFKTNIIILICI